MTRFRHVTIGASVGSAGTNRRHDVREVQELLNTKLPVGTRSLRLDGIYGPLTAAAIDQVQRHFVGMVHPDGRIDPHGRTLRALNHTRPRLDAVHPVAVTDAPLHLLAGGQLGARRPAMSLPMPTAAKPPAGSTPSAAAGDIPTEILIAAKASQSKWHVPASVSIAQWILESGSGKHMPPGSNNPFGIKAGRGQPSVTVRTREETADGRSVYIDAPFRKFASLGEAFDQHGRLLASHPAYTLARQHVDDPDAYADALTHHYATDSHYGHLLKSIMKTRRLYQYN